MNQDDESAIVVSVDGGGSGCRLAAFDENGCELARVSDGPASLTHGEEQAFRHVRSGIAQLAEALGRASDWLPGELLLGLAGSLQEARRRRFLALLPDAMRCTLVTDGHAQLLGASAGRPGACLALGTGSVLHWLDSSGDTGMAGGWGFPAGDEASGAWLGLKLVNALLWQRDRGGDVDDVLSALLARIGYSVSDLQVWSTMGHATELATLAPMVVDFAGRGDRLALSLLAQGALECDRLLELAPDDVPVYLVGGLASVYRSRLAERFRSRLAEPWSDALHGLFTLSTAHAASPAATPGATSAASRAAR